MITPTIVFFFLLIVLVISLLTPLTYLILHRQLLKFIEEEKQMDSKRIKEEFGEIILNHLDEYLAKTLPESNAFKEKITVEAAKMAENLLTESTKTLNETLKVELQKMDGDVTTMLEEAAKDIQVQKKAAFDGMNQQIAKHIQTRIDGIDDEIMASITEVLGQIIQRELTVEEHTEFIKQQLVKAREYYER